MTYIETGVRVAGERVSSKRALREALLAGTEVSFDPTYATGQDGALTSGTIPADTWLSVVGPDPATHRRWFARVAVVDGAFAVT